MKPEEYQSINTGLLAFGLSGRVFHAPFIQSHPGFKLVSVTERSHKKANHHYPEIKSYETIEQVINTKEIELIVVNTPNYTHFEFAKQALHAGKHVIIEKALTISLSEAQTLFNLGKTLRRKIMVYQNRRWDSDFQSVKNVVESGRLGDLIEVHFRFDRYTNDLSSASKTHAAGSGIVYGLMPHLFDQAISLFGKPLRCLKTTGSNRPGTLVDDYAFFHLIYPNNLNVYLYTSFLVAKRTPAFVLHGLKGSYIKDRSDIQEKQLEQGISPLNEMYGRELPGMEGELTLIDDAGRKTTEYIVAGKGNYMRFYDAVYQHIRHDQPFPVAETQVLCQMEAIEQ